jgi:hypothetical protein
MWKKVLVMIENVLAVGNRGGPTGSSSSHILSLDNLVKQKGIFKMVLYNLLRLGFIKTEELAKIFKV